MTYYIEQTINPFLRFVFLNSIDFVATHHVTKLYTYKLHKYVY